MIYEKLTLENYIQIVAPFIAAFNAEPTCDEWTVETATKKWKHALKNPNFEGYAIKNDIKEVVGFIGGQSEVYYIGDTFVLEDFFIIPIHQGKGIGTEALSWFETLLKNEDITMLRFFTSTDPLQQGYYQKRNYQVFDDLVFMAKELN